MGLKEIYLAWEDKWYGFLDRIDSQVHVYGIVDRIDKVVPSFVVFLIAILCIALLCIALAFSFGQGVPVTIIVEDAQGNLLANVKVDYAISGSVKSGQTNQNGELAISVPPNSSVEITVDAAEIGGVEYEAASRSFFVESSAVSEKIVLREKEPPFVDRTILLQNAAGERITGKAFKLRLSCQTPLVVPSPMEVSDLDMDGSITVREPKDCGVFQATIIEPREFKQKSYILGRATQAITLESADIARGNVRVKIKDSSGNIVVSSNFEAALFDADGMSVMQKNTQNYGEALFSNIEAGTYSVSVSDASGRYGIAVEPGIEVSANETAVVDIVVGKTVKATLKVKVVDKGTNAAIANAAVKLIDSENEVIAENTTGAAGAEVSLYLTDQGNFTVFASHEDYLYETVEVKNVSGQKSITIALEKITEANSGRVEVKVLDEDNAVVRNARVKLKFFDTGMLVPIAPKITDANGLARFSGVKAGKYYAYVEKFPASGEDKAGAKEIDVRQVTRFTVKIVIGDCIVKVSAFDEDSAAVTEAEAEFFSEEGESLGKISLSNGTGQFGLKADKRAYVVVTHPDFMAVQTMPGQLWPDKTIEFKALMEPRLVLGAPKVEFEGIFDLAGKRVQMLKAGTRYIARFKLSVPEEGDYSQGGFHFRVGDEALLINDPLVIREAIAGSIDAPLKATSYSPPNGYEEDALNITEGDAKWINIFWQKLEPKNYYFGFEIRVKSQITPYTRLPMHYRAWAIDGSGDYIRAPEDAELGSAESTANKQALYAKTLDLAFLEGQEAECQEDFCYSGESILDEDEGLYIYEPYKMRNGAPHKFTFSILNNSPRQYENSGLYITVTGMTVDSYKVQNASAQEIKAGNVSLKEFGPVDLGAFTKGKSISGEVHFVPNAVGNGSIEVKVIADGRVVFLKTIAASVLSEREMEIAIDPAYVASYVAAGAQVKVTDKEQGYEIENAIVRITVKNPDKTVFFYTARTNGFGIAAFSLPALQPGTALLIEAEKPDYYAEPLEMVLDGRVIKFTPEEINVSLDTRGNREYTITSEIQNLSAVGVTVSKVGLSGKFKGLLDEKTMVNFSRQFEGTTFRGLALETMQFFKVKLSQNAGEMLLGKESLEGEFIVTLSSDETLETWDIIVPLKVKLSVGGLPDNSPCISVTRKDWVGATQGNSATVEFEIRNNCMSGNRFVELENLQAKLNWTGDEIGVVELTLTEAATGASSTSVLRSLVWSPMLDTIQAEGVYYAMLTFTPKAGHLGEKAEFEVMIDGEIRTDNGYFFVGSSPSSIKSRIDVINLEQCIQYKGAENVVSMKESLDFATFEIDGSNCGETNIDIYLCYGDSGCKGGATEGEIGVIPEKFTLTPKSSVKEIRVERRPIAGMYGVTVFAKIPGSTYREVHVVDVLVHPKTDKAFYLNKYNFSILGKESMDSTVLTNRQYEGQFDVKASVCAWGEAAERGAFDMGGAMMGAGIGFTLGVMGAFGAGTGTAVFGLAFCPPCAVVMAVLAVLGGLIKGLFGADPCEEDATHPVPDWIMNLRQDAQSTSMDNEFILASWVTEDPKYFDSGQTGTGGIAATEVPSGSETGQNQEVGIAFENLGIENIKPTYSIITIAAKKHNHDQPTDYGDNSSFGSYNVRDREVVTYVQKFHLKFDTKIALQEIPPINYDTYECTQGTMIGRTGPGSLPKIKLNWNWDDISGISIDSCDYGNEEYVYCDATQFSIELSKKLHALDELLEANRKNISCPTSKVEKYITEMEEKLSTRAVESGKIGLSQAKKTVTGNSLQVDFQAYNDTSATQTATVKVELAVPTGASQPSGGTLCERTFDVAAQQAKMGTCIFTGLGPSAKFYGITAKISSSTTGLVDANQFSGSFRLTEAKQGTCWLPKTTTIVNGKPAITYFFAESGNIAWTDKVPNVAALENLLHFKAYLIKDGYSEDFRDDFAEYSMTEDFFNAPAWFATEKDGKFADYFKNPFYLDFTNRYVDSDQLPNAGLYDVVLDINFIGDDWKMFDDYSEPNAKAKVEFYFLKQAYPNSIFYYMPFNGNIGVNSANGRQGYGMAYDNAAEEIMIRGGGEMVKTATVGGSTPVMNLKTDIISDFKQINATASNRGFIMSIDAGEELNEKELSYYPNYATPVLMKMSSVKTDRPFSAFFELRQGGTPVETGGNMSFWDGAGRCLDYSGVPVAEAFDFKPDREADNSDSLENWQFAYAVDWTKADYAGNVYLKSVFYTPIGSSFSLKALQPKELRFITPDSKEMQGVELHGISGMAHNNGVNNDNVNSLQNIFNLAAEGKVCVVNTGIKSTFWWNPKTLYEQAGTYTSIKAFEQSLVAGKNCINYGS